MKIDYRPGSREDIPQLWQLWKEAFGDDDNFLDTFYILAFSANRCRVAAQGEKVLGAVYWFSCTCRGQEIAYLYALATEKTSQGQGIATELMKSTWEQLERQGVNGTVLVPASTELIRFYAKMGYVPCAPQGRMKVQASGPACNMKPVSPRRYGELRRNLLPSGGVVQEGANLEFLAAQARLYAGKNFIMAASTMEDGSLMAWELLSKDPVKTAPAVLKALHIGSGLFRVPYPKGRPCALFRPLSGWEGEVPQYFAFEFS